MRERFDMTEPPIHPDNAAQAEFWNGPVGRRWLDRSEWQDVMLRPVDERLLAAASPRPGERVIDVGCGCGATAIDFAGRVSPGGEVTGIDLSEPMLARARELSPERLSLNFVSGDAAVYQFPPGSADLVVSRFGVMFFADPALAFGNLAKALRPGGRIAFACWRAAKLNPWMTTPVREALKHVPPLPESGPEDPGPFAFASEERVHKILLEAGYNEIAVTPRDLLLDIARGGGLEAAVAAALTVGPMGRMLDGQTDAVRAAVAADVRAALAERAIGDSVPLGAAIWIVTARKPENG
jgi:SAM-dependent methyltransferase